eukprot:scaffold2621_cov187-Skeletonema_marinoi.AAC.5
MGRWVSGALARMGIVIAAKAAKRFQSFPTKGDGCIVERCHGADIIPSVDGNAINAARSAALAPMYVACSRLSR